MKTIKLTWLTGFALSLNLLGGCGGETAKSDDSIPVEQDDLDDTKSEAWNGANNPAFVDNTFTYASADLPLSGEAKNIPWAGDYWATANDSINYRWDGDNASPAEKVAQAFGLASFPKDITDNVGIYGHGRKECDTSSECTDQNDGSDCVKPRGATGSKAGRCIPGWWGICHGWTPAALSEPNPTQTATKNGVTFYPGDIQALASFIYQANLPTKFLSQRCDKTGDKLGVDNNGRVRDAECRDMNPGSMHVVVTNMIGIRKIGIAEDRTYDDQVWNQPVRKYVVTNGTGGKLAEITKAQAVGLLGLDLTFAEQLAQTSLKKGDSKTGTFTAAAAGSVVIKTAGTGDADLYVKKNGAVSASAFDCKSDGGTADETCKLDVAAGDKLNWLVLGYSDTSAASLSVGSGAANPSYTYNTAAARFFHVEMDLYYISEQRPGRSANNPDDSTQTDHLSYVLEADAAGKIIGGEWIGSSQRLHPDFMWWPTSAPTGDQFGLTYKMVKDLIDQAAGGTGGGSTGGGSTGGATTTTIIDATVARGASKYSAPVGVTVGKKLTLTMTGTGNADLYVRIGRNPTIYTYNCKSTNTDSNETCSVTAPAGGGTYYVRARGMAASSAVTVTATIE